jgi:hypothetical protein
MSHIINVGREVIIFAGVNLYPSNIHVKLTFPLCIQENKTISFFSPAHHSLNAYKQYKTVYSEGQVMGVTLLFKVTC